MPAKKPKALEGRARWNAIGEFFFVRHVERDDYIYLGTCNKRLIATLRVHPKGLLFYVRDRRIDKASMKAKRYIIPGEFALNDVVEFLIEKTGVNDQHGSLIRCKSGSRLDKGVADRKTPEGRALWRKGSNGVKSSAYGARSLAYVLRRRDIARVVRSSGFWKRRGRLGWNVPREFFRVVSVEEFVRGSTASLRAWWKRSIANALNHGKLIAPQWTNPASASGELAAAAQDYATARCSADTETYWNPLHAACDRGDQAEVARLVEGYASARRAAANVAYRLASRLVDASVAPESPTIIRKWPHIGAGSRRRRGFVTDIASAIAKGWASSSRWGVYATQLHRIYGDSLFKYHPTWAGADANQFGQTVDALLHMPARKAARALDAAIAAGLSRDAFVQMDARSAADIEIATLVYRGVAADMLCAGNTGRRVTDCYVPPNVELPDGWLWATHESFYRLSVEFNNCISNTDYYENRIAEGRGHVAYRPDLGAVAFFDFQNKLTRSAGWSLAEIKAPSNRTPARNYVKQAQLLARSLQAAYPNGSTVLPPPTAMQRRIRVGDYFAAARSPRQQRIVTIALAAFGLDVSGLAREAA